MPRISYVVLYRDEQRVDVVLTDAKRFKFAYKARNTPDGPEVTLVGTVAPVAILVRQDEDEVRENIVEKVRTTLVAAGILREALAHH